MKHRTHHAHFQYESVTIMCVFQVFFLNQIYIYSVFCASGCTETVRTLRTAWRCCLLSPETASVVTTTTHWGHCWWNCGELVLCTKYPRRLFTRLNSFRLLNCVERTLMYLNFLYEVFAPFLFTPRDVANVTSVRSLYAGHLCPTFYGGFKHGFIFFSYLFQNFKSDIHNNVIAF